MRYSTSHLLYLLVILLLCLMGVAFLFSTGYLGPSFAVRQNYLRQCLFLGLGAALAVAFSTLPPGRISWRVVVFSGYFAGIVLLVAVLFLGKSIGGARRWLSLGGFLLQPAEFARAFTILAAAALWDGKSLPKCWEFPLGLLCFLVPMGLILLEPAYGNAASLAVPMGILACTRYLPRWLWNALLLAVVVLVATVSLAVLHLRQDSGEGLRRREALLSENGPGGGILRGYHLRRVRSFLSSEGGWNEQQSLMAVAGGGLTGKGYLNGTMKNLGFLPRTVAPTDFIFAVVAEEGGLLFGVLPLLFLYWLLAMLLLHWAARAADRLRLNILLGGTGLLLVHIVVGVGMAVRLLPVIGLPLPLLSYGGSFTLAVFLLLGAMAGADHHREEPVASGKKHAPEEAELRLGFLLKCKIRREE